MSHYNVEYFANINYMKFFDSEKSVYLVICSSPGTSLMPNSSLVKRVYDLRQFRNVLN